MSSTRGGGGLFPPLGLLLVVVGTVTGCAGGSAAGQGDAGTAGGSGGTTAASGGATVGSGGATAGSGGARAGSGGGAATGGRTGSGGASSDAGVTVAADAGSSTAWRPFDSTSPWNTRIAADAPIDPNSAQLISDFSSVPNQDKLWMNIGDYSIPVYWVDSTTTPLVTVSAGLGGTGFRTGAPKEGDVAGTGQAPIPANAMPAGGTDRHLAIVDRAKSMEWGFFNAAKSGTKWTVDLAATQDLAGSGVRPPEHDSPWWAGHGPRACGFGLIAGLITTDDIKSGRIDHALVLAYPHVRSRYYTPPASSAQGTTSDALPTRGILCGGHIQLDPSLDVTKLGLSTAGVMIARALQEYGAFVGDYSGAVSLYADSSPDALTYWSSGGGVLANESAGKITLNRFRVLKIGTTYDNMN